MSLTDWQSGAEDVVASRNRGELGLAEFYSGNQSSAKMSIIRSTLCDLSYGLKDTSDKISGL